MSERLVRPNTVVLDVGANLGSFCYMVRRTRQPVRLVAFEPIPILAKRLRRLFTDTEVLEVALSDVRTVRTFRIPYIEGRRCNSRGSLAPILDTTRYTELKVQTDRLDNLSSSLALTSLDLVKIDIEGHEFEFVKGGEQTLRQYSPLVLIEIEQRHHPSEPIATIGDFIEGLGYTGFYLNRQTLEFDALASLRVSEHQRPEDMGTHRYINNFLFIPRAADVEAWRSNLTSHLRGLLRADVPAAAP